MKVFTVEREDGIVLNTFPTVGEAEEYSKTLQCDHFIYENDVEVIVRSSRTDSVNHKTHVATVIISRGDNE